MPRTPAGVEAWGRAHARDMAWGGWCEKAVNNAGALASFPSALRAARASGPLNPHADAAPLGAFHYWDHVYENGVDYGHVAIGLSNGAGRLFMASNGVTENWGRGLGVVSLASYHRNRPAPRYIGWSMRHGSQTLDLSHAHTAASHPTHAPAPVTWKYYDPTGDVAKRIQRGLALHHRYSGAIDGVFGPATRKGIQITLRSVGYSGPIDGKIEAMGCGLIQTYAKKFGGYTGRIDNVLGPNSWAGFAKGVSTP